MPVISPYLALVSLICNSLTILLLIVCVLKVFFGALHLIAGA